VNTLASPPNHRTTAAALVVPSRFSTHGRPADKQLLAWRDRVGHIVDVRPSKAQVADGFSASIDRYAVGSFVFTEAHTDSVVLERSVTRVSMDATRDYVFHLAVQGHIGHVTGVHKKRSAAYAAQGIVAFDLNQPFVVDRPACQLLSLFVPKSLVESGFPDAEGIHGRIIERNSPLTNLVFDHMVSLSRDMPAMHSHDATNALHVAAQLLIATFQKQVRVNGEARAAMQSAIVGKIRRFVDANLHHSALSPSSVVDALELKRATVYRWFDHEGGLGAYIRNRRLREAADELIRFPQRAITEIAYGLGFKSASDFTRAFRRAYGLSPRDARVQASELQCARHLLVPRVASETSRIIQMRRPPEIGATRTG
jgi:AraC-like DNA-binding protein